MRKLTLGYVVTFQKVVISKHVMHLTKFKRWLHKLVMMKMFWIFFPKVNWNFCQWVVLSLNKESHASTTVDKWSQTTLKCCSKRKMFVSHGPRFSKGKKGYSSKTICHKPLWRVVEKGRRLCHMGQGFLREKKSYSSKTICHKPF